MSTNLPSTAVARRKAQSEVDLMPPPPKKIKRPPVVLDEDVYTDALSYIIARDFFPGLLETRAQQDYLDALDAQDSEWIREAGQNLKAAMTPAPRESGKDPAPAPATDKASSRMHPPIDLNMSLQAFQAKYTSEDNASFNDVLDSQNFAKAKKYAHLRNHTNTLPSKRRLAQELVQAQRVLTSSTAAESPTRPSQDLSLRSASYDSFPVRQGGLNALMFSPDGFEASDPASIPQAAEIASLAPPRKTNFSATRLSAPEASVPESPSLSAIDAAISGRPRLSGSEAGSSIDGSATPRVAGWAFVDEDPTEEELAASSRSAEDLTHLLPTSDGGGPSFRMSGPSRREDIHRKLVEQTARRDRRAQRAVTKDGGMTPAARSLAGRMGTPIRTGGFGSAKTKEKAWTPLRKS